MSDWLSAEDLASAVTEAGYPTSIRQLERWREARLLTPSSRGIAAVHAQSDVHRCIVIHRSLREKDELKQAREVLWAAGFDVDRSYWRPAIEKADRWSAIFIRYLTRRFDADVHPDSPTFGDWFAQQAGLLGMLGKVCRKLSDQDQIAAFAGVMADAAAGRFVGIEHEAAGEDGFSTKDVLMRGLGMERSTKDAVYDHRLHFDAALQPALTNISSAAAGGAIEGFSDAELCAARDDVRNGLKAAYCLNRANSWFLGNEAFGLGMVAGIGKSLGLAAMAALTPPVARLRRIEGAMIPSQTVAQMALQAEASWNISNYFYELQRDWPEFREICGPEAMKNSFRDSVSHDRFLESLREKDFPEPRFEPWNLWRSTSKTRKMPAGLLVMSIGSPDRASLADILESASGADHRLSSAATGSACASIAERS